MHPFLTCQLQFLISIHNVLISEGLLNQHFSNKYMHTLEGTTGVLKQKKIYLKTFRKQS